MAIGSLPWGKIAAGLSAPRQGNDFFSAFQAGLGGVVNAQLLEEARRRQEVADQLRQQLAEREFGLAESRLSLDRQRADYERQRLEAEQAKANAPPEDYGVISGDIQGPLLPGTIRAPQNLPKGGYKSYAEAYGRGLAESKFPKPVSDNEPLVQVVQPDGSVIYLPRSQAIGRPAPRPGATTANATQRAKAGILRTVAAAEKSVRAQEDRVAGENFFHQVGLETLPNVALSEEDQKYKQAADWWIENVLREASGAVINPKEYPMYRKIYFGQVGDKPETVKQKRASREAIQEKYRIMAGTAAADIPPVDSITPEAAAPASFDELEAKYGQ